MKFLFFLTECHVQIFCIQTCQGIMWKNQTLEVDIVLQESDICQSTSLQQIHWN